MIELHNVSKRYGSTIAVDRLSVTVRPGRVTGFLGPNGAGKSTTLRMIVGLNDPTSGTVTVAGTPFRERSRGLRQVGALLAAGDVHGGRSAYAHLSALAVSNRIPRGRVREVLHEVGLASVTRHRIGRFSLGMRQRLGIAATLLGDPPVLLFDEPFNGLDPEGVLWVRELFQRLAREGRTVFVSSHFMSEMEQTAEHLVVIGRGRLIADESLAEFADRAANPAVTVRTPDAGALTEVLTTAGARVQRDPDGALTVSGATAERVGELAYTRHILLHQLFTQPPSLEDAFLELTADSIDYPTGATR